MVDGMQPKEILRAHVQKIVSLTDDQFEQFFSRFKLRSFKKGQVIISEGSRVEHEYFVLEGSLKTFFLNEDMKMFILQFAMPTWWASDYNALYSRTKATVNVDCITDAEVLCLSNTGREEICKGIHEVEHFFRWRTNRSYVALREQGITANKK